jgi:hypothetical protein
MTSQAVRTLRSRERLGFEEYCQAVRDVGLDILATQRVFSVFDANGRGSISPDEFIFTLSLLSNQPAAVVDDSNSSSSSSDSSDRARSRKRAQLYFSLFDLSGEGRISQADLAQVAGLLIGAAVQEKGDHHLPLSGRYDGVPVYDMSSMGVDAAEPHLAHTEAGTEVDSAAANGSRTGTGTGTGNGSASADTQSDFLQELFAAMDADDSGSVTYEEFEYWFDRHENDIIDISSSGSGGGGASEERRVSGGLFSIFH